MARRYRSRRAMTYKSCGACEFCGCHTFHHEACPNYERAVTPKRILCTATFVRGGSVEWWEWLYDEERKRYINSNDGSEHQAQDLLSLVYLKQAEGWQLCRAVV